MKNFILPEEFGTNPRHLTGIVEDRADPQQRGRCRVRWWGYYSDDIPVSDLPWSIVIMDVTSAGIAGVGQAPVGLMIGTVVLGTFLDGNSMQNPAIMGVIGPIEGLGTPSATINSNGVKDEGVIGPNTPSNAKPTGGGPPWMQVAQGELGVKEVRGGGNSKRVLEYAKENGFSDDNTPWCSSFAKWCAKKGGAPAGGVNGLARSWLKSSWETISDPLHGCIVVFSRGPAPYGHVGFVDSIQGGRIMCLGGNQGNAVSISGKSRSKVLGFRWPGGFPKEPHKLT